MVCTSEVEGLGDSGTVLLCIHVSVFVHNYFYFSYCEYIYFLLIIIQFILLT